MKKLFREIKLDMVLVAVAGLVLGLLLLLNPEGSGLLVTRILALALVIYGLWHLGRYLFLKGPENIYSYDLSRGIIGLALGIFNLASPKLLLSILPVLFGAALITDSVFRLQNAFDLCRMKYSGWWLPLLLALATGALGVVILFNPFGTAALLLSFIGVSLIVNSVIDFWNIFSISSRISRFKQAESDREAAARAVDADIKENR